MDTPHSSSLPCAWQVFQSLLAPEALNQYQPTPPQTAYTPWVVSWLLIYQRLHNNASLGDAVAHFLLRFPPHARPDCKRLQRTTLSANTATYSQARSNLNPAVVDHAVRTVFDALVGAYPPSWNDRRAFILDGTTLSLAPTDELKTVFPPASNQNGSSHWPVMHAVVAHELASGLAAPPATGAMYGPDATGEVDRAEQLLTELPAHSVLLADRNFGVFAFAHAATGAGHDVVVRLTDVRFRALLRNGTRAGKGRWKLAWKPSPHDRKAHPRLPADAMVGGWLYEVRIRADLTLWLFSTLESTGAELGALYGRRLNVETDIRDLKATLELDGLRGRSASMVRKELLAALVAYNLTNQVRRLAAARVGVEPRRLSFAGVWGLVRQFAPVWPADPIAGEALHAAFDQLLRLCGQRRLPKRALRRSYPREVIPRRRKFPERKRLPPDQ
jgi:hypothetical protein